MKIPEIAACATQAASMADMQSFPDAWGPLAGPSFEAWRTCERRGLPAEPYFAQLTRDAREISERLAHAK